MTKWLLGTTAAMMFAGASQAEPFFTPQDYPTYQSIYNSQLSLGTAYTFVQNCSAIGPGGFNITTLMVGPGLAVPSVMTFSTSPAPAGYSSANYTGNGKQLINVNCASSTPTLSTSGAFSLGFVNIGLGGIGIPTPLQIDGHYGRIAFNCGMDYSCFQSLGQALPAQVFAGSACTITIVQTNLTVWAGWAVLDLGDAEEIEIGVILPTVPGTFGTDFPNAINSPTGCPVLN